jgi:hypothetical protein
MSAESAGNAPQAPAWAQPAKTALFAGGRLALSAESAAGDFQPN